MLKYKIRSLEHQYGGLMFILALVCGHVPTAIIAVNLGLSDLACGLLPLLGVCVSFAFYIALLTWAFNK